MSKRAYVIKVDGTVSELDHLPTLEEAQKIVGGWVEFVTVAPGIRLVVDEGGKLKGKPVNKDITSTYGPKIYGGYIVGDVLVLEGWRTLAPS